MPSQSVLSNASEQIKAEARGRRFGSSAYYQPTGSVLDDPVERKRAEARARRFVNAK
jgi:hypothetical protein